jgi:hypothetical protein
MLLCSMSAVATDFFLFLFFRTQTKTNWGLFDKILSYKRQKYVLVNVAGFNGGPD